VKAPSFYPRLIQPARFARNAMVPEYGFAARCADAQNHVNAYRHKTPLVWSDWVNVGAGVSGTTAALRFRYHSGHNATSLNFLLAIGLDASTGGGGGGGGTLGADPGVQIDVKISGGATTTSTVHQGANAASTADTPSNIAWRTVTVAITANTDYEVTISTIDYGRILSACAYETGATVVDSSNYFVNYDPTIGFPIYSQFRKAQLQGTSTLWRHNGPQLVTWPGNYPNAAPTNGTTTWKNVLDDATVVSASTAGFKPMGGDMSLLTRLSDGNTLDVVLSVYCSVTGSATGEVRFQDSTGTRCSITGMGTAAAWYTLATTIAATDTIDKLDLQFRSSNALNTITLHAVSLFAYLA
jgi:hypothetical protein